MVTYLWSVGDFVRRLKLPVPSGSVLRAQLRLLRLELKGSEVECWLEEGILESLQPEDCVVAG